MNGNIHGLCWFPNIPDKFVIWGQEINLYEVHARTDHSPTSDGKGECWSRVWLSSKTNANTSLSASNSMVFLSSDSRYQYVRCLQPSYHKDNTFVAVGMANGKVGICNFQDTIDSNYEFSKLWALVVWPTLLYFTSIAPRQQRSCLCLAWNESEPNILAIGHDRNRSDSCITIWDIEHGLPKETGGYKCFWF